MTDTIDTITLDGINDFTLFGNLYSWDPNEPAFLVAYAGDTAGTATVNGTFTGDWFAYGMEIRSGANRDLVLNFDDTAGGNTRYIGQVRLFEGDHTFNLVNTGIESLRGFRDANYDLTFGQFAQSVWLNSGTGNSTTITLNDGGGVIRTQSGTNTITANGGFTDYIRLGQYGEAGTNTVSNTDGIIKNLELYGTTHDITVGNADIRSIVISDDGVSATITATSSGEIDSLRSYVATTLVASSRMGSLDLGDGNDVVTLSGGATQVSLGSGDNILNVSDERARTVLSYQGEDVLNLTGTGRVYTAHLGQGDNVINMSDNARAATLGTWENDDTLNMSGNTYVAAVDLGLGSNTVNTSGNSRIDAMQLAGGADTIDMTGGSIGVVDMGQGDNTVTVDNGGRITSLATGNGTDIITITDGQIVTILSDDGDDVVQTATQYTVSISVGEGNDTVTVDGGVGMIDTWRGNDVVTTGSGFVGQIEVSGGSTFEGADDDIVTIGSGGAGRVWTGAGNDTVNIGNGFFSGYISLGLGDDVVHVSKSDATGGTSISGGEGLDTVDFSGTGQAINLTLNNGGRWQNIGNMNGVFNFDTIELGVFSISDSVENVTGTQFADIIKGSGPSDGLGVTGDNVLKGGLGADRIFGLAGDDEIHGDGGEDDLYGAAGQDTIFGGGADDRIFGGDENDILDGGAGDDLIRGGSGNDTINGDVGGDRLIGNDGNDTINGGGGGDLMFGGNGADTFVFDDTPNLGVDRVKDWQDGTDVLDLTDFGFGNFAEVAALASTFNVTDVRILFEPAKGIVLENFALADFDVSDVIL